MDVALSYVCSIFTTSLLVLLNFISHEHGFVYTTWLCFVFVVFKFSYSLIVTILKLVHLRETETLHLPYEKREV